MGKNNRELMDAPFDLMEHKLKLMENLPKSKKTPLGAFL